MLRQAYVVDDHEQCLSAHLDGFGMLTLIFIKICVLISNVSRSFAQRALELTSNRFARPITPCL